MDSRIGGTDRVGSWRTAGLVTLVLLGAAGCELEQVALVDAEDVVVAEVYLNVAQDPADNEIRAFLHRTVGAVDSVADLQLARVTVSEVGGPTYSVPSRSVDECVESSPVEEPGACFILDDSTTAALRSGGIYEVEVELVDGRTITGAAEVPGAFALDGVPAACRLPPDAMVELRWSRAEGAWAYLNETSVRGLPEALRPEDIVVEDDPLYLLGLSISDSDTTISFPAEFGVFNRLDLEQDLAVRLQEGLPAPTSAQVSITAVDRNFVNWARGGNFNPSGQVRVPSLRGAGTGVFAATVGRSFQLFVSRDPMPATPECPGAVVPE